MTYTNPATYTGLNSMPQNSCLAGTCDCGLIWDQDFAAVNNLRGGHTGVQWAQT